MIRLTPFGEVLRIDLARTLAGKGSYWTTCYWVDGLLIDTGCSHTAGELVRALESRPVERVVNTHSHEDHIGCNGRLQRGRSDLLIQAHPLALPVIARPKVEQPLHLYRRIFWGWPEAALASPLMDGEVFELGGWRYRVIYTPGHSADHLCLFEENRGWLFSGDLFVGGRDRALRQGCDIWGIMASLARVHDLPVRILFPGSARVRENPCQEIRAKLDYYQELGERIGAYYRKGWSLDAITRAVCGGPMWIETVTLGHFARKWLVLSYLHNPEISQGILDSNRLTS
jgi:glyoxylase-like metal-dependent hydrolase (beta-lactamase superfamily II)